jgi:uncharacterized membrane protein YdjX (TVP38/TMEM64 family)
MRDAEQAQGVRQGAAPTERFEARDLKRPYVKAAIVVGVLALFALLLRWTPLADLFSDVKRLQQMIDATGAFAPLAFLGLSAALMFLGAPRLVFCTVGGALFGFLEGLALSQVATLLGALGPFLFARWGRRTPSEQKLKLVAKAQEYLKHRSVLDVFLLRQLPVWGAILNLILGSSDVPLRTFLVGSFFGYLPQSVVFSLIGSGFGETTLLHAVSRVFGAVCMLALFLLIAWRAMKRRKRG